MITANGMAPPVDYALKYRRGGCSPIRAKRDRTKKPEGEWKRHQTQPASEAEILDWFGGGAYGIAIAMGIGSGNAECIDLDDQETADQYVAVVNAVAPGLIDKLTQHRTPRPGLHLIYRCATIEGNLKLASVPDGLDENKRPKFKAIIETRGRGGYIMAPGSPPDCHPTGRTYEHIGGPPLESLPTITVEEREILFNVARSFDRRPKHVEPRSEPRERSGDGLSPGDDFNARATWESILEPHGWRKQFTTAEKIDHWLRPGKTIGTSATTGLRSQNGTELFYCFSSNASPFEPQSSYSKFAVYTQLRHNGDFPAAARQLSREGYGDQPASPPECRQKVEKQGDFGPSVDTNGHSRPGMADLRPPELRGEAEPPTEPAPPYRPFPAEVLPAAVREYIEAGAECIGCDSAYVALPTIVVCAGAIGNSRVVELKRGWREASVLWGAVIGESGTQKSPAAELSVRPINEWQQQAFDRYEEELSVYEEEKREYDQAKKRKGNEPCPSEPKPPICERYLVSDVTVEGLVPVLQNAPRGVISYRDELNGWFASFDRYAGGKGGGDEAFWLSAYGARPHLVDRKTGDRRMLRVPRAAVSVTGTIQPGILHRSLGQERKENGLLARLLLVYPPRQPKRWNEAEIPEHIEQRYTDALDRLLRLEMLDDGPFRFKPQPIYLATPAKRRFIEFVNHHGEEAASFTGPLAAAYSKLEGTTARLALMIAMLKGEPIISLASVSAAITLIEWFKYETARVYRILGEDSDSRALRELAEWIARHGREAGPRDLTRASRRFANSEDAELALGQLVKAGYGTWQVTDTDGRQRRTFRLTALRVSTEARETSDLSTSVNADDESDPLAAYEWNPADNPPADFWEVD